MMLEVIGLVTVAVISLASVFGALCWVEWVHTGIVRHDSATMAHGKLLDDLCTRLAALEKAAKPPQEGGGA